MNNHWNNSYIGNYWDDYLGSDNNGDGIGDIQYSFTGGIDYLPKVAPYLIILSPINETANGRTAPSYSLWLEEPLLDRIWYTVDEGQTNYTLVNNQGILNQSAWQSQWDSLQEGATIHIRFYINDTLGNTRFQDIFLIRTTPPSENNGQPTGEPFPFLIIIIIVTGVVAAVLAIYFLRRKTEVPT